MDYNITTIDVDSNWHSIFTQKTFELTQSGGMHISQRQQALNFRYRKSLPGYHSDWHVAGDPTLIAVQAGCIEIKLRNGQTQRFSAGDSFIAADYLPKHTVFNQQHGHMAKIIGDDEFVALHFKLGKAP